MKTFDKIPVFLHIPKAAGTYVQQVIFNYLIRITDSMPGYFRKITIENEDVNLTVYCNFLSDYWKSDPNMKRHPVSIARGVNNPRAGHTGVETFKTYMKNDQVDVMFCVVEPVTMISSTDNPPLDYRVGLFLVHELLNASNQQWSNFIILRDCFSRQQSLFNYINSASSKHEPSHGCIRSRSFNDYIMSNEIEDNWMTRALTGAGKVDINESWCDQACDLLDNHNFLINDISKTDQTIDQITYDHFTMPIEPQDRGNPHYNSSEYIKKIKYTDLSPEAKKTFDNKTQWDRKLYETHYR